MKKLTREVVEDIFYRTGDIIRDCAKDKFINELEKQGYLEEPLTFEKIRKECISGETKIVDNQRCELTYIGFYDEKVVTGNFGRFHQNKEEDISNWRIKK